MWRNILHKNNKYVNIWTRWSSKFQEDNDRKQKQNFCANLTLIPIVPELQILSNFGPRFWKTKTGASFIGLSVGWLAGWLVGWLAGWLVGWLVG